MSNAYAKNAARWKHTAAERLALSVGELARPRFMMARESWTILRTGLQPQRCNLISIGLRH